MSALDEVVFGQSAFFDGRTFQGRHARQALSELAALRARVAELEAAQPATLTPRQCRACRQAAETMREKAAVEAANSDMSACGIARSILALPLPDCGDCNPLAPDEVTV